MSYILYIYCIGIWAYLTYSLVIPEFPDGCQLHHAASSHKTPLLAVTTNKIAVGHPRL